MGEHGLAGRGACVGTPPKTPESQGVGLAGNAYQWYLDGQPFGGEAPAELPMGQRLTVADGADSGPAGRWSIAVDSGQ